MDICNKEPSSLCTNLSLNVYDIWSKLYPSGPHVDSGTNLVVNAFSTLQLSDQDNTYTSLPSLAVLRYREINLRTYVSVVDILNNMR